MKNFIFDLYGTLADVRTDEFSHNFFVRLAPYFKSLSERDIDFEAAFYRLFAEQDLSCGREADIAGVLTKLFEAAGKSYTKEQIYAIGYEMRKAATQKLKLYPGTKETLAALKRRGKGVYLLSNAQALFTAPEIESLGLKPLFDGIELSSDYGKRKPSPDFFNYLLNKYGLDAKESVYIGNDYQSDIIGANAAGLKSIYIRTETSPADSEPKDGFDCIKYFLNGNHKELYAYLLNL